MKIHFQAGMAFRVFACAVPVLILMVSPVLAQAPQSGAAQGKERETRRQADQLLRANDLDGETDQLPDLDYSAVLAAPDDPAVNLNYARALIRQGNIQLASVTLERLLLKNPDADNIRLLYAIILFRMDVIDEASAQLDILDGRDISDGIRAGVAKY
ncbi:MAG: tetratricopeptide repeat protein, partial [Alphaproteobacteria bacterium]